MRKTVICVIIIFCINIAFANDLIENNRVDTLTTINSFSNLGDFYTINYSGDYEEILDMLDNMYLSGEEQTNEMGCSLFSGFGDETNIFLGRNFDNPQQDILVGKYSAPDCYSSIAVNRLADMGLPLGTNFSNLTPQQELLLLRAPYFTCDGVNEMGLAVGVAYVDVVPVQVDPNKDSIWLTRWLREILDHAADVEDAINLTNNYNILDNFYGQNTLCHHLLLADSSGNSAILEYHDGTFDVISPVVDWQVLTNTHIYNHTLQQLFNLCYRYELLYSALEDQDGVIYNWRNGLDILELPTWGNLNNGTQWSNLYDTNDRSMYLSVYQDFDNIVKVDVDNFLFLNHGVFDLCDLVVQDENNNNLIEAGETVYLVTFLTADYLSTDVVGELSCENEDIEITNGYFEFGDILPEQQVSNTSQLFSFNVSDDIVADEFNMLLHLTTDYDYEYEIEIPMEINPAGSNDPIINHSSINLQNHPNPFNPVTTITFNLPIETSVNTELIIYNLKGQKVRTFSCQQINQVSDQQVIWDGTDENRNLVSSGIYLYELKINGTDVAKNKCVLLK